MIVIALGNCHFQPMRYIRDGNLGTGEGIIRSLYQSERLRVSKSMGDLNSQGDGVANLHATPRDATEANYAHPTIVTALVNRIIMPGTLSELWITKFSNARLGQVEASWKSRRTWFEFLREA